MSYRVCIPCAGTGSRLGGLTRFINKSLVSVANRPTLSHLIEQFPSDVEFVIALGYKGHLIREFLSLAYPSRQFFFTEVAPFEGPGSGLGLSLSACKRYLDQPFIFVSCDTLVEERIRAPDENWMGYAEIANLETYRTVGLSSGFVVEIAEKGENTSPMNKAYIGLSGVYNHKEFWLAMEEGGQVAVDTGEAHGMRALLTNSIRAYEFTWHDTGNPTSLAETRYRYREVDEPNILEKANEAIWFVDNNVIKFSDDASFIANRVKRCEQLKGFVPDVSASEKHMYRYEKVQAQVLSKVVDVPLFDDLLEHCQKFWKRKALTPHETKIFREGCRTFYFNKTLERVDLFYRNFNCRDGVEAINNKPMPRLEAILNTLDWHWLADGLPGRFHGDLHFENILWSALERKFVFLDWRQDFAGDLSVGDIYYDLAKLLHGLIVSHELITRDFYNITWLPTAIKYDFHRSQKLVECERRFAAWLDSKGYDRKKVWVLTALIYLNIAALHHHPYSLLLYAHGKSMLQSELEN